MPPRTSLDDEMDALDDTGEGFPMLPTPQLPNGSPSGGGRRGGGYAPLSGTGAILAGTPRRRIAAFVGLAVFSGIAFHFLLSLFGIIRPWGRNGAVAPPEYLSPGDWLRTNGSTPKEEMELVKLQAMVDETQGYLVRDWSLNLGWNNMRYIIETGLLHAQILNRTLVLPSFVYARACEFNNDVCGAFAKQAHRGQAVGSHEWDELPEEEQQAWQLPIEVMIDLPHLRTTYGPVITTQEYLRLNNLSPDLEGLNGWWQGRYNGDLRYAALPNSDWDPFPMVRVDRLHPPGLHDELQPKSDEVPAGLDAERIKALFEEKKSTIDLDELRSKLREQGFELPENPTGALEALGFRQLYTYDHILGMDFLKSPVNPVTQVAAEGNLTGLWEEAHDVTDKILHIRGEIHLYRRAGSLYFTSPEQREEFRNIILGDMKPLPRMYELAARVDARMRQKTEGRAWMTAHMRRGDFVRHGWAMEGESFEKHADRIKRRLSKGQKILAANPSLLRPAPGGDTVPPAPAPGDPFYVATDERNATNLDYLRSIGGVVLSDVLTTSDRDYFGPMAVFTDVLALLEQVIMSHGAYFYGHALSSVAGGVVNLREAAGYDPRTRLID